MKYIIDNIKALATKIISWSCMLTSKMLPNRKLYKSSVNPPARPINITPTASPADNNTATAESGGIFVDSLSLVIPSAAKIDTMNAVHIGYKFANNPIAIPPNAMCERASANNDCRLKTRNSPTTEQVIATATPETNARCMKPYWRISNTMICQPFATIAIITIIILDTIFLIEMDSHVGLHC